MNETELREIKRLLDEATCVPTKNDAKPALQRLQSISSCLSGKIDDYSHGKLIEAISFAKDASGQVNNKEHWINCMSQSWLVFKAGVKNN